MKDGPDNYSPAITWTGFYVGLHAGASFGDSLELVANDDTVSEFDIDNSFVGGIHIGYNWQKHANWIFGIEAALGVISDELVDEPDVDATDYIASVRGRIGYAMDRTLIYGTGGVAFIGYDDVIVDGFLVDDVEVGFVVGAGFDHKITNNLSFGVEALYYNFSSDSGFPDIELDRDLWTVQARLNYHFTSGYDAPLK